MLLVATLSNPFNTEYFSYRRELKRKKRVNTQYKKSEVENSIELLLQKQLVDDVEYHVFEVNPKILDYVLEVIDKPPLANKYTFTQLEMCLFRAELKKIDLS